jgi:hypothetical protein
MQCHGLVSWRRRRDVQERVPNLIETFGFQGQALAPVLFCVLRSVNGKW